MAIIGNKCDLFASEEVKEEEAREFADRLEAEFELVSALEGTGVNDLFMRVAKKYHETQNHVEGKKVNFKLSEANNKEEKKKKKCC